MYMFTGPLELEHWRPLKRAVEVEHGDGKVPGDQVWEF